jgi:hypothetical protein
VAKGQASPSSDFCLPNTGLLTSIETARVMGFATTAALSRARKEGRLPFRMFRLPGRRGWFALTSDVRTWLEAVVEIHLGDPDAQPQGARG